MEVWVSEPTYLYQKKVTWEVSMKVKCGKSFVNIKFELKVTLTRISIVGYEGYCSLLYDTWWVPFARVVSL